MLCNCNSSTGRSCTVTIRIYLCGCSLTSNGTVVNSNITRSNLNATISASNTATVYCGSAFLGMIYSGRTFRRYFSAINCKCSPMRRSITGNGEAGCSNINSIFYNQCTTTIVIRDSTPGFIWANDAYSNGTPRITASSTLNKVSTAFQSQSANRCRITTVDRFWAKSNNIIIRNIVVLITWCICLNSQIA